MSALPLLVHDRPEAVLAYRAGVAVSCAQFLADVRTLARRLPAGQHVLNLCSDRYRFSVGLAASLLARKCTLLPSSHTPEVIRQLKAWAPDVFCLSDDPHCPLELPQLLYEDAAGAAAPERWSVPQIEEEQLAAYVFTSGSTGAPVPHRKSWGRLVRCVRAEATRLPPLDRARCALLGTVPAQHMFGFESTVLLPWQSGNALCAERPFFPADITAALAALPRPRVLVTTPIHLRSLLAAQIALPPIDLVVSATAMLPANLAREVERRCDGPLLEIYGSTETGQIAVRRTAHEDEWRLWPGVRLEIIEERCWVQGGHVEQLTPLADVLELRGPERFVLHGRTADLVNIAGKRSSIAYLNHHLHAIPGIIDGTFYLPAEATASSVGQVTRLAAMVVAPGLDATQITCALRERIDPAFLPRPLLLVDALPRNQTGKLPQQALHALAAQLQSAATDRGGP
jgi:acyl-coenzyme A synthetase/AMP-(fatty) acid ligase